MPVPRTAGGDLPLRKAEHRVRKPLVVVEHEDETSVALVVADSPSDDYLRWLVEQHGGVFDPQHTTRTRTPMPAFRISMSLQVQDLRRLTAKVALCEGARRWGDTFLLSELADWLRVVLDIQSEWPPPFRESKRGEAHAGGDWPITAEEVQQDVGQLQRLLRPILYRAHHGMPMVGHCPNPPYIIAFAPADDGRATVVWCVLLGYMFPLLAAPAPLPDGPLRSVITIEPPRGGMRLAVNT